MEYVILNKSKLEEIDHQLDQLESSIQKIILRIKIKDKLKILKRKIGKIRAHGKRAPRARKVKPSHADCHPDALYYWKGMCRKCYNRAWRESIKTNSLCHPERKKYRKNMCRQCYERWCGING